MLEGGAVQLSTDSGRSNDVSSHVWEQQGFLEKRFDFTSWRRNRAVFRGGGAWDSSHIDWASICIEEAFMWCWREMCRMKIGTRVVLLQLQLQLQLCSAFSLHASVHKIIFTSPRGTKHTVVLNDAPSKVYFDTLACSTFCRECSCTWL